MACFSTETIRLVNMVSCPHCGAFIPADEMQLDIVNGGGYCRECKESYINTTIKQTFDLNEAIEFIQSRPDYFSRYTTYFFDVFKGKKKKVSSLKATASGEEGEKMQRLFLDAIIENAAHAYFKFIERKYLEEKIFLKYAPKAKKKSRAATQLN